MGVIVRGVVEEQGDVYFYVGYGFKVTLEAEIIFFKYLKELSKKIQLEPNSKIFGGWPVKKEYGELQDNF